MKYLPLLFLLLSCSPAFHCRKCQQQVGISTDTTSQIIPVHVPEANADTTVALAPYVDFDFDSLFNARPDMIPTDTIVKETERVVLKIKYLPGEKVYVKCECKDTIVEKEVPVLVETKIETGTPPFKVGLFVLLALLAGGLIVRIFGR